MKRAEEFVHRAVVDGWLEIDSSGQVWRLGRQQTSRWGGPTVVVKCERRRAESNGDGRYLQVRVMFGGVSGIASAHRLVWFHFNGPIPEHLTINHKDGNKRNNHPANLELATVKEQMLHAMRVLGHKPFKGVVRVVSRGSANGQSKLTESLAREILSAARADLDMSGERYGITRVTMWRLLNRQSWRHISCD